MSERESPRGGSAHETDPALRQYHFATFTLDAQARTLLRAGEPVALPAKAFDCIVYLVENHHRAVGRDELIAAVWGKVDIGDNVLGQTILLARKALDDSGRGQQFIRTVMRFGYQWVAPLETAEPAPAAGSVATEDAVAGSDSNADRRPSPSRRWRVAVAVLALLALAAAATYAFMSRRPPPAAPARAPAAAAARLLLVLPARVQGGSGSAWMRLGLMSLVAERLRTAGVAVAPDESVVALARAYERAQDDPVQLRELAAAAGADIVVGIDAEFVQDAWRVKLHLPLAGTAGQAATGDDADALAAARNATDALAAGMGLPLEARAPATKVSDDDALLQQVHAALLEEKLTLARSLLDTATPAQRARPALKLAAARIDYEAGHLDTAAAAFRALLDDPASMADPQARGEAWNALGGIELVRKQPKAALPLLDEAIRALAPLHADDLIGRAYGNRAAAHAMLQDYDTERADLAQARIALSTGGDALGLAILDSNRAASAMNRDRYAEAEHLLATSVDRYAAFRAYAAELNARSNLGLVQLALLEPEAALATDRRIVELLDKVPASDARRVANLTRVQILVGNGRDTAAAALLEQVRRESAGDAFPLARVASLEARLAFAAGDLARAEREARASIQAPIEPDDARERATNWLILVRAQLARGDAAAADASLARASTWAEGETLPNALPRITLARAERAAWGGDVASARTLFDEALAQAERGDVPLDRVDISAAYIPWLLGQRDFARASIVAEGIASWAGQDFTAALAQLEVFHALRDPSAWRQALERTRALAGERAIPPALTTRAAD